MPTYVFQLTTDHRKTVNLDIKNPPLRFAVPLGQQMLQVSLFLYGTIAFNVEVVAQEHIADLGDLADVVLHVISGLYDALGLSVGGPLEVRIAGFWELDSSRCGAVSFSLPSFSDQIAAAGLGPQEWISIVVSSPQLRAALRDIRLAMETPGDMSVHCYRAIERIRQFFAKAQSRRTSWQLLAESLNVNRSWLDSYTAHATAVRHGEIVSLGLAERDA